MHHEGDPLDRFSARLRAASPKAEIIVTGAWNNDVADLGHTDPLFRSVNATIARVAAGKKARFANTFPAASGNQVRSAPEQGQTLI